MHTNPSAPSSFLSAHAPALRTPEALELEAVDAYYATMTIYHTSLLMAAKRVEAKRILYAALMSSPVKNVHLVRTP